MTRILLLTLALLATPFAASAMPAVGDIVGTNAEAAKAALEKAGCPVNAFESEDGKIEAICTDATTAKKMDVTIDPANGAILTIKDSND
ncbi:PepSY domain-containing protein [Cypionkella sp.]|uniref:PepSY domain-containing protein n=1 Tax=Cypionkella sp. TaxID=2811411 RepID=UPI00271A6517|nr:PepSY domain-containing protein [Cypionkella sp.]MDO8985445.1 PepSY domain-containing protein [Cypionkella sp.]MDP2048865.1 PepSY domain-containing protein [Cypionkella sp.]